MDFRKDLILRWPDPQAAHIPILKKGGIQAILLGEAHAGFAAACKTAGIETALQSSIKSYNKLAELPTTDPQTYIALAAGLWPGIARGPAKPNSPNDEVASASSEPWIDANAYRIPYLKALYPKSAPVLAYEANKASGLREGRVVGFETLEIAYSEARAAGGNYILSMEASYRDALLKGDPKATAAWVSLGTTAHWFSQNDALFGIAAQPTITALVDTGTQTAEFANLLFRRNASPTLAAAVPEPSPSIHALVTVGMRTPAPNIAAKILAHAERGATVITDDPAPQAWWRTAKGLRETKQQEDRVFYALGRGTLVTYKERVMNPSELALDVIDVVTHPKRPVRIWNTFTVIALAGTGGVLHLLNYASVTPGPRRRGGGGNGSEIQVRMQGLFAKARLLQPGAPPKQLETARRGSTTEVWVPTFDRVATVVFS